MKISSKTKRRLLWTVLILTPLLVFLLYPLGSPEYAIVFDEAKINFRKDFLAKKPAVADSSVRRPNIIVILADDLGKTDISLYGSPYVKTPNIDSIGLNGVTCSEGYITSPICSPSRAGLLTGRYQQRFGFELHVHERYPKNRMEYYVYKYFIANSGDWRVAETDNIAVPRTEDLIKQGLPPTELVLPELLRKHGYKNAIMGKWHLGYNESAIPLSRGFDYHYGFYEAFSLYAPLGSEGIEESRHEYFSDKVMWDKGRSGNCAIRRNGEVIEEPKYITQRLAEEACDWMQQNHTEPFFLYVPFSAPHTPFQAPSSYTQKYAHISDHNKRVYYAMIHSLDDAVGQIMAKVRQLGIEENTIVFFLSDNGGAAYTHATDNAPLRGGKLSNFEGGINVPYMVQWKGNIPPRQTLTHPVSSLDVFATACALAGVQLPTDRIYDGVNLMPCLTGQNTTPPHETLFWRSIYHKAIRHGDWKLLVDEKAKKKLLFNMTTDKGERFDLSEMQPDTVQFLQQKLAEWEKGLINSRWPHVMDYHIRDGKTTYYFPL